MPQDYSHPNGTKLTLTISRIRTADPHHRKGYLLVHPGGPGISGLDFPSAEPAALPKAVIDSYDLIGVDDRGIGNSSPVSCHLTTLQRSAVLADPWPSPTGDYGT